jgi:uncharacterized membrane protein YphA (DoxX/SURF4 family)
MSRPWKRHLALAAVWLASALLALMFVRAGWMKFPETGLWARAFAGWGFPAWFRVLVGAVEVAGGLLLLVPRTAVYAALALGLIMLGGMGTHVVHGQPAHISHEVVPLAALLFVVWLRRRLRPKPTAE